MTKVQRDLLRGLTKIAKGKIVTKTIPFRNNDVPIFLRKLDKFEKRSRKTVLMVKACLSPCTL